MVNVQFDVFFITRPYISQYLCLDKISPSIPQGLCIDNIVCM